MLKKENFQGPAFVSFTDFYCIYNILLDMVQNDWQHMHTDDANYSKTREVSFTLSLTHPMGPKHSRVTETQVCLKLRY